MSASNSNRSVDECSNRYQHHPYAPLRQPGRRGSFWCAKIVGQHLYCVSPVLSQVRRQWPTSSNISVQLGFFGTATATFCRSWYHSVSILSRFSLTMKHLWKENTSLPLAFVDSHQRLSHMRRWRRHDQDLRQWVHGWLSFYCQPAT